MNKFMTWFCKALSVVITLGMFELSRQTGSGALVCLHILFLGFTYLFVLELLLTMFGLRKRPS